MGDFRMLSDTERRQLIATLRGNAEQDEALRIGRDTSFVGSVPKSSVTESEVLDLIASVPSHY